MESKLPDELYWELVAVDEFNSDAPDGAWWALLEDQVSFWNKKYKVQIDEHDMVHLFIKQLSEKQKGS